MTGNRKAFGFSLAMMFDFAAFASFLSSTELLFDRVYDRSSQFPLAFGLMSTAMGLTAFGGSRLVSRFGAESMIGTLVRLQLIAIAVVLLVSVAGSGPNFFLWFGLMTVTNALRTLLNPLSGSVGMQSMGDLAGTAASIMGTISLGGGALLGSITDRFIRDSVMPLSTAYLVYGVLQVVAVMWALDQLGPSRRSNRRAHQGPASGRRTSR